MEQRAMLPPGLPHNGPTISYWQTPTADIADHRSSETMPGTADIVIIGSGISGATTAYRLLEKDPTLKIVMVEARQAASGATGRNGGHTKHVSYSTFAHNVQEDGRADAIKIAKLEYNCMVAIHDFIKEHSIDCDAKRLETVDVYYDEQLLQHAQQGVKLMQEYLGENSPYTQYEFFNPDKTAAQFLTPNSSGSVKYGAGSLSAYKLTIGILRLALAQGLNLQTNTPATKIERTIDDAANGPTTWTVQTNRGAITAPKLLLATNGYIAHLYKPLQGTIIPLRGEVTAHRPGTKMPQTGLPLTYSFAYTKGFEYAITQPAGAPNEGDVVIGGGLTKGLGLDGTNEYSNTDDTTIDPQIADYLYDSTPKYFGSNWGEDHPEGRTRQIWSGIMGYSADHHPFVGPVPDEEGLFLDASFQGHGMVLCFLCAQAVAQMMLGKDGEELDEWFPRCFRVTKERINRKIKDDYRV